MPNGAERVGWHITEGSLHEKKHWERGVPCPKAQSHISNKQKMQVKKLPLTIVTTKTKTKKNPRNLGTCLTKKHTKPFLEKIIKCH